MEILIHPSVSETQRRDPRFLKLYAEAQVSFNSPESHYYKLLIALHEAGHAVFARRAGATGIVFRGPEMHWDSRPQYDCPAISRSSCGWTRTTVDPVSNIKADIAGFICRRELTKHPNDRIAIESDLETARYWFDQNVGTGDEAFQSAVQQAEREILEDLKSETVVLEIWAEAQRFMDEIFPTSAPKPEPKVKYAKVGRNDPCPCGSGKNIRNAVFNSPREPWFSTTKSGPSVHSVSDSF